MEMYFEEMSSGVNKRDIYRKEGPQIVIWTLNSRLQITYRNK